jgi:hypothetical protein
MCASNQLRAPLHSTVEGQNASGPPPPFLEKNTFLGVGAAANGGLTAAFTRLGQALIKPAPMPHWPISPSHYIGDVADDCTQDEQERRAEIENGYEVRRPFIATS